MDEEELFELKTKEDFFKMKKDTKIIITIILIHIFLLFTFELIMDMRLSNMSTISDELGLGVIVYVPINGGGISFIVSLCVAIIFLFFKNINSKIKLVLWSLPFLTIILAMPMVVPTYYVGNFFRTII